MRQKNKFKKTKIGVIPEDWEIVQVKDIASINELSISKKFLHDEIEYIDIDSVNQGKITQVQKLRLEEAPSRAKRIIRNNDIIISTVRPNLKHFAFIKKAKPNMIASTGFAVITAKKINPQYLYYFLTTDKYTNFLSAIADSHTSTYPAYNPDIIENSFVPYPSPTEQNFIAKILSDLDLKIELLQNQNKILEKIGRAIFKHWFVDFEFPDENGKPYKSSGGKMIYNEELGKEIPEGWKVSKIDDKLKTILGGTPDRTKKEYWENGTISWINSGAINDFPVIQPSEKITEEGLKNSAAELMPKRTVVLPFVISLGKEIKISILGIESSGNQSVLGILENEKIGAEYIFYWVQFMKEDIYSWATGGAQQHINKGNVDRTKILLPNQEIQQKFNTLSNPIFERIINNSLENQKLVNIRDSLLPKLMSGRIRVPVEASHA